MSAAERALYEKKIGVEKEIVYRVARYKLGHDANLKGVEFEKVQFMFKESEVFVVTTSVAADGERQVAFLAGDDLWSALLKWSRMAEQGQLPWRGDKRLESR